MITTTMKVSTFSDLILFWILTVLSPVAVIACIVLWKEYKKNKKKQDMFGFVGFLLFAILNFYSLLYIVLSAFGLIDYFFYWTTHFIHVGLVYLSPVCHKIWLFFTPSSIKQPLKFAIKLIIENSAVVLILIFVIMATKERMKLKKKSKPTRTER